jgi:hypothetical protein
MRTIENIQHRGGGALLEPWEMLFLRTGEEPDLRHALLFSLIYETTDWRSRWEAASEQILKEWFEVPKARRPLGWIRYLADIGYLSLETRAVLEADNNASLPLSA